MERANQQTHVIAKMNRHSYENHNYIRISNLKISTLNICKLPIQMEVNRVKWQSHAIKSNIITDSSVFPPCKSLYYKKEVSFKL